MISDSTRASKAGHFIAQSIRRRGPILILLSITLIIIYPFRSTLIPINITHYQSQPPPSPSPSSSPSSPSLTPGNLLSRPISHDKTTIPKLIHQTWFPAGTNMSASAQAWVQTVKTHHPDWEYVLWDDETDEMLVREYFPWFLDTYRALPREINRADMARNFYMFLFGGLYTDVDTEALRPVEPLFTAHEVLLKSHWDSLFLASPSNSQGQGQGQRQVQRAFMGRMAHTLDPEGLGAVPNGWMASPPGHPFWLLPVLSVMENPKGDGSVEGMTGPGILGPLIKQYYSSSYDNLSGGDSLRRQLCRRIQAVQPDWDLFCPRGDDHLEDGGESQIGHSLVLLPREQVYPFSWVDDGDMRVCLGSKGNLEFDSEACVSKEVEMYAKSPRNRSWNIALCTFNWIFWSNLTILFNKWILESTPFQYPILLTTWHLLFATLATQLLSKTTSLLTTHPNSPTPTMTTRSYITKIVPIALLYSGSLVTSNMAYMYLNVGFIQMLKASGPVITLLTSYLWSVTDLTVFKLLNILLITGSVALTVSGELRFSGIGVLLQFGALVCDANRLVLLQILSSGSGSGSGSGSSSSLEISSKKKKKKKKEEGVSKEKSVDDVERGDGGSGELEDGEGEDEEEAEEGNESGEKRREIGTMNPLLSLYYTAPICTVMNGILAWRAEVQPLFQPHSGSQSQSQSQNQNQGQGQDQDQDQNLGLNLGLIDIILTTGIATLILNAIVGFMLNVAVFTLIGKTSGLTMTLVSIPKNILLIIASVVLWGTRVSTVQAVGYFGALVGLVVYSGGGSVFLFRRRRGGGRSWGG
ncbi:triose-phosphate transporter family-domain-containing protein [Aspergillus cavernicola]|uniref:Triose-phosphate transporter family-domain-containing protein n=1 Tax=Aspergillus cavernicola TaxID=176166 RepID=A0ABR4H8Z5_9EURO